MRARPAPGSGSGNGNGRVTDDHDLERFVDIHAFDPGDLSGYARRAGFADIKVRGLTPNERPWLEQELERLWGSSLVVSRGRTHELELELGLDWDSGAIALRRRRALWYRYRPSTKRARWDM